MSEILELGKLTDVESHIADSLKSVVVLFHAPDWCMPCRKFHPHFVKTAEQTDAVFIEIDVDTAPDVAKHYDVMSVPTVKLFSGGEYVKDLKARTVVALINEISS